MPLNLTPREAQASALVAEGLPNKLIADRLSISEWTVRQHLKAVFKKLGVTNRVELAIRWLENQ